MTAGQEDTATKYRPLLNSENNFLRNVNKKKGDKSSLIYDSHAQWIIFDFWKN